MGFEVGDKVVCLRSYQHCPGNLKIGQVCEVVDVQKDIGEPEDLSLKGYPNIAFNSERFAKLGDFSLTGDVEIDLLLRKCIETLSTKGVEYTGGSPDRLNNFRQVGEAVGIPMEKAFYVFFNKHIRALESYIKNDCEVKSEESIHGRIMDLIVYLLLFEKMSLEIERNKKK
jgi:hypothetical protein